MIQPTIEELNLLPINQMAEKMLVKLKIIPDSQSLFCVQLALWALEEPLVDVNEGVAETMKAMLTWKPVRLMNFFMPQGSSSDHIDFDGCEASQTPQELACKLVEIIENKAMAHFPWYFNFE